jgi:hypothetical protein
MSTISVGTEYRGVVIDSPARSRLLTISIGDQRVALNKWQAKLLAEYLNDDADNLEETL